MKFQHLLLFCVLLSFAIAAPHALAPPVHSSVIVKRANIEERVKIIIAEQLGVPLEKIKNETPFLYLGADEQDVIELIMALEEKFDIDIPDEEAQQITTVQRAIDFLRMHLN